MVFVILVGFFFAFELFYFWLANHFNIIDKPNSRSSHRKVTLRGGGIIFPISIFSYFVFFNSNYPWFTLGLLAISIISFADDITPQSRLVRFLVHFLGVLLLMYQLDFQFFPWYAWLIGVILIIGVLNAYNFMDGINGITAGYSASVLITLWLINQDLRIFDDKFIYCLALGNLVFGIFNFRKTARCFAGDVGSISIAFALLFLTCKILLDTGNPIFILLFALYGVDTVLTIIFRLYKKENIFDPHRHHLFQYLANEKGISQLKVSSIYALLQLLISIGVYNVFTRTPLIQWLFTVSVLLILAVIYCVLKYDIIVAAIKEKKHS